MKFVERRKLMRFAKVDGLKFDVSNSKAVSRTQQQFAKEADINFIMSRYMKTGVLVDPAKISSRTAVFDDFSSVDDYRTMHDKVINAQQAFQALPAKLRARMNNDPAEFVAFVEDEANKDECIKLGLKVKSKEVVIENSETNVAEGASSEATV